MDVMTKLDAWGDDSSFVDKLIGSGNLDLLKKYSYFGRKGSVAYPSPSMQLKGLTLLSGIPEADVPSLMDGLLPPPSKARIGVRDIMNLGVSANTKALALLRTQASIDVNEISQEEIFSIVELTTNPDFIFREVNSEYLLKDYNSGKESYESALLSGYELAYEIAANYKFGKPSAKQFPDVFSEPAYDSYKQ